MPDSRVSFPRGEHGSRSPLHSCSGSYTREAVSAPLLTQTTVCHAQPRHVRCLFAVPLLGADGQVCPTSFGAAQTRWTHTGWHPRETLSSSVPCAQARGRTCMCGVPCTGVLHTGVPALLLPGSVCARPQLSAHCPGLPPRGAVLGGLWSLRHWFDAGEHGRPSCPRGGVRMVGWEGHQEAEESGWGWVALVSELSILDAGVGH